MAAREPDHPLVRVAALVVLDERVLLARHRKDDSVYHLLPGGGVRMGETLGEALVREVAEETGLQVAVGRPLIINDTIDPNGTRHVINITFAATVTGGVITTPEDHRIEAVDLVDPAELLDLDLRPPIALQLRDALSQPDVYPATYLGSLFVM